MKENEILNEDAVSEAEMPSSDKEPIKAEATPQGLSHFKKKLVPILVISFGALIVIPLLLALILNLIQKDPQYEILEYPEYEFAPVYEGDILHYSYYLGKNRDILYFSNREGYGEAEVLNDETSEAKQKLLYSFVQSIICGDEALYNSFFSKAYFASNEPQKPFAQQMLYDICIYLYASETLENGETSYTYQVDYRIAKNNGTYRTDIGSDMSRSQYVTIRQAADGNVSIEKLAIKRMAIQVK